MLPSVAWDDSNEFLKWVLKCKFSMVTQICWDSQTLAFQGPVGPSRPMPCPRGHALLKWHILNLHFNFHLINSHWKWGTEAPEAHGAQVLPDPELGSKEVTYPHQVWGVQQLLFYKVFTKIHCWGSRTPPAPLLGPLDPRVRVGGLQPNQIAIRVRDIYKNFGFINSPS